MSKETPVFKEIEPLLAGQTNGDIIDDSYAPPFIMLFDAVGQENAVRFNYVEALALYDWLGKGLTYLTPLPDK